ncbi:MAG: 2Fe-2S iron-sulfur cluster-binding protein [Pirellulaceae bacterium]|nr:2Fe-2S iron-sulfur cluster-binding protein [Pirellulaceae bacterium]
MSTVFINDIEIEVGPKENLVQAAERAGVEIPHYCWHHDLSVVASCRMCLVEVGEKKPDGTIAMIPKLVPACQTPAKPNTVVITNSEKVKKAQAQTLEFLLLNHPLDCSICDQAGECYLQDYTYKYGKAQSRLNEPKVQRVDKYHIGEQIALFTDRCVMCTRCVRFTREISGTSELHVTNRGSVEEIDVYPGEPCNNKLAGNVVDLCPVGALCSKDFLYKKRVWWLKTQNSVCQGCSTGCSIHVDQEENRLYRIRPRENHLAQGSFMCDEGRFGWKYIESEARLFGPRVGKLQAASQHQTAHVGNGSSSKGNGTAVLHEQAALNELATVDPWPSVLNATRQAIKSVVDSAADRFAVVLSPMMFCEEAFMLAKYIKSINKKITLALGPVPVVGEDDIYPKGPKGEPPAPGKAKFTIRAEKCPNRLGVEAILKHFQGEVINFGTITERLNSKKFDGMYLVGGYPEAWLDASVLSKLDGLSTLIVQDFMNSPLTDMATIVLASATFAERQGTVVNHAGLAQEVQQSIRGATDIRPDGRLLFDLSQRQGMYSAASIRAEMAKEIPAFGAFAGEIGELGIQLFTTVEGKSA